MFCTLWEWKLFLCIVITALNNLLPLPFSFPETLTSFPAPSVYKWGPIWPTSFWHTLWPLCFPCLKQLCCVMWRPIVYVCLPSSTPAVGHHTKSTFQSYRALAVILAPLQRVIADDRRASTGGRVQRSSLLPCWVPGVHPFMDRMSPIFSFVNPGCNSILCKWSTAEGLT